jgi:hypothetical protein
MSKYLVSFTEEDWYSIVIEAESAEEAQEKFWSHDFNDSDLRHFGTEIQDSVEVEQL